ncbi:lycopene cyclase domain-containing protein [Pedobacter sp. CG_S7]|uniref:lycopene cyclase domain-containing protein n=1 Tax=Pedobacter sp. CG_S7 TaxID=3143930 RepID=UPI00339385A2
MNNSLLLNLILLFISILLYFDQKVHVFKAWKAYLPGVIITGIAAVFVKLTLTRYKVNSYDQLKGSDVSFFEIPMESALLCFTLPLAVLVVYNYLNGRFPKNELEKYSLALSNILLGLSVAVIFFAYTKAYAVVTFSLLLLLLFYVEYVNKDRFMYRFYRTYSVFIVLFAVFQVLQLLLDSADAVVYNFDYTMKFKLIAVPFENYFLLGIIILSAIYLFEYFKRRYYGTA